MLESEKILKEYEKKKELLNIRERDILERYYSFGSYTRHALIDIAKIYKVSRERIRQIK
jgi:DNA-directed RNA polymerase sigma subunit (sigma70/sigma32)